MARILIFNSAAHGHLNPTLPVTRELLSRGEQVTYVAPSEAEPMVRPTGAAFVGYPGVPRPAEVTTFLSSKALIHYFALRLLEEAKTALPLLLSPIQRLRPDVLAYDAFSLVARMTAELLGLRRARLCPTYVSNDRWSLEACFHAKMAPPDPTIAAEIEARSADLTATYGVRPLAPSDLLREVADLNVVFLPRAFQPQGDTFDERFVFTGPSIAERHYAGDFPLEELDKEGRPILFVSLGTVFNDWPELFEMSFRAFGGGPWRVVVALGDKVDPAVADRAPPGFLVRTHVPQLEVLKRARAFVSHGGMNSTMEAIYFGVPLVVIPQMPEQAITAERVSEMGLGVALDRESVTIDALARAVSRVTTEPAFAAEIGRMRALVHAAGGYRRAAQALQDYARARPSPRLEPRC